MHPTRALVALCSFSAVTTAYVQPPSDAIIKHEGKPVGRTEVHDGGILPNGPAHLH